VELYLNSPNTPSRSGAQLKHRDNFTFYLLTENVSVLDSTNGISGEDSETVN